MVLTPLYSIKGDIEIYSILSITIQDSIENESDSVVIVCEGFKPSSKRPKIEVSLGYLNGFLWSVGTYILQSVTYKPNQVELLFTSAEFNESFKEKKTISFQKLTIKELVTKIASKHDLKSKCDMEQFLEHIDQRNESDLALLNRIANRYNAIFNIKNNTLIFLSKTSGKLPIFKINALDAQDWSLFDNNKYYYNSVQVKYHDTKYNKIQTIKTGDKKPVYIIEDIKKSKKEALDIAKAKLQQLKSKSRGGNILLEGQNIIAGAKVKLEGFGFGLDSLYLIKNVEHKITTVFTSTITIEAL